MRQGKGGVLDAKARGKLGSAAVETQAGAAAGLAGDFNFEPGDAVADAGSKSLGGGFLGGEAGGEAFRGVALAQAIGLLQRRLDAVQKAVAKAADRPLNAHDFGDVNSRADEHVAWRLPQRGQRSRRSTAQS